MFKEFKEFIARGNVLDMAIGIIMGSAFTAIVTSMVDDILMPIISGLTAGIDYQDIVVSVGGASLKVGNFINAVISFLIIAFVMFLIVKGLNSLHKEEAKEEVTEKECPYCKSSIPVEASRCPHCTSKLDNYNNVNE
ncbi:large conductance mechanosensitive channel protein MscL [Anaerococcus vaginimassiliensis]|uniref:large conductance mechanosensitive channel protein MscL n=1 Tax=Anaerococcus vaginimassiliensis TaxID=2042308 RepID=UPI0010320F25|nr:large conductance mechanosensitive channel protein MscL [Anaerococcus vaginimassiliensis]